jgi:C1A family cysteine protease
MGTIRAGGRHGGGVRDALVVILTVLVAVPLLAETPTPRIAPKGSQSPGAGDPRFGFVPPPGDLSHIKAPMARPMMALASDFDWRVAGKVTPVKDQQSCGSCYAFASIGNFESRVLIDGGGPFDFSENNVKECEFFGSSCGGGNYWRVANYLATNGTVQDTCDPYVPADVTCNDSCPYVKTLLEWCVISFSQVPATSVLKSYVENYGPVYTSMYAGDGDAWHTEFSNYDGSYTLYYGGLQTPNHAVLIVGWDDNLTHAGGQGAWIVKNSWGTAWGDTCGYGSEGGYFTIAYGSAKIGTHASFLLDWQDYDPNGVVLYHDEGGYGASVGYGGTTAWGLSKYVPAEDISIERVEVWTLDTVTDVDVYIYDDFSGGSPSNLLASRINGSFSLPGYHPVELSTPLDVSSGNDIYVVAKITDASYTYPLAFDDMGPQEAGTSYLSSNGSFFSEFASGDLCIRVRASRDIGCGEIGENPVIVDVADVPGDEGGYVNLSWRRTVYDDTEAIPEVARYRVWRKGHEVLPVMSTLGGGLLGAEADGPYEHGLTGPAWELVATIGATGTCCYDLEVPTHCDSSGSDTCWTYFYVTAHTGEIGQRYDSSVDRGYSVDNLGMLHGEGVRGGDDGADGTEDGEPLKPATRLHTVRPNPGKVEFRIRFDLATADWIQLELYDVTGRRVAVLSQGHREQGRHVVGWRRETDRGTRLSPGLYFVRLVTSSEVQTVKLVLVE